MSHPSSMATRSLWMAARGLCAALALASAACRRESPAPSAPPAGSSGPAAPSASAAAAATTAPNALAGAPAQPIDWKDEAAARGFDYLNVSGEASKPTILEANGAGIALLDLGADGDLDIACSQGLPSLASVLSGPGADLALWSNDGSAHFARAASPGLSGWWTGLAAGDLDNDGRTDLVAGAYGDLVALAQDSQGALHALDSAGLMPEPAAAPGARLVIGAAREPGHAPWWTTSVALFDADRDGFLDLYACNYLELDPVAPPLGQLGSGALEFPCAWKGLSVYCGPKGMKPQPDRVFRGRGDGRFEDVSARWLPEHAAGYALAVAPQDWDQDGDTDLYVANDSSDNLLLDNDGHGVLRDRARAAGVAVGMEGNAEAGMGVAWGDVDRDGRPDFALANFSGEPKQLYFGAEKRFRCMTFKLGMGAETARLLSWSVHLADVDADGRMELLMSNGHVYPQADQPGTDTSYDQPLAAWRLPPGQRIQRVQPSVEASLLAPALGARGSALGDLDGDGWLDWAVIRIDRPAALGLWAGGRANHRLVLRCSGASAAQGGGGPLAARDGSGAQRTPRDAIGTRVRVELPGSSALLAELQTSVGYQSSSSPELFFGLGAAREHGAIEILWPSGAREQLPAGAADRRLTIEEGRGIVKAEVLP